MSGPGIPADPVAALAAQAQPQAPMQSPLGGADLLAAQGQAPDDPVMALAQGHAPPPPPPAPPGPQRHLPQWAVDMGVADPWDGAPGSEGGAGLLVRGATMNFGDEMLGAMSAAQHNFVPFVTGQPTHFKQDYEAVRDAYRDAADTYTRNHPGKAIMGEITASLPTMGAAGAIGDIGRVGAEAIAEAPTFLANLGKGAATGATYGGITGFGGGQGGLGNRLESGENGALWGAATGLAAVPVVEGASRGATALGNMLLKSARGATPATQLLADTLSRDNIAPADAAAAIRDDPTGQFTLADLGGKNSYTQRLGRALVSLKTPASPQITEFMDERNAGQLGRFTDAVHTNLTGDTDTYGNIGSLIKQRGAEASPLYEKAYAGGSIAPFEDQLRTQLQAVTGAKGLIVRQMREIEQNNPGALAARGAAGADVRTRYMDLNSQLQQAEAQRTAVQSVFDRAKTDATSQAPGAVWTPRIQQFLDDPIMKQGLNAGLEVQRLEALAEGKTFNPAEYAIVGKDEAGNSIVGAVPNMRLLNAAKVGLDNILEGYRDPVTLRLNLDQRGRAIDNVRKAFVSELDNLNPDYKAARAAWAGPSAAMDAVEQGQRFMSMDPEQITSIHGGMNPQQQQFFRLGAGRAILDKIRTASDSADLTKRIFGNPQARAQIESVFGKEPSDAFAKAMASEKAMTATKDFLLGNSSSINKALDFLPPSPLKQALSDAVQGGALGALAHGPAGAAAGAIGYPLANIAKNVGAKMLENKTLSTPENAAQLGRLLTTPGEAGAAQFEKEMGPAFTRAARSKSRAQTIGKLISKGMPTVGANAGLLSQNQNP